MSKFLCKLFFRVVISQTTLKDIGVVLFPSLRNLKNALKDLGELVTGVMKESVTVQWKENVISP